MWGENIRTRLAAEALGSAFLVMAVVGSGIMADSLSGGNSGVALLGNTLATAAMLFLLISLFGSQSGAHFNPLVSLVMWMEGKLSLGICIAYALTQTFAMIAGVILTHLMFARPWLELSQHGRGAGQIIAEAIAAFGLVLFILLGLERQPAKMPMIVAAYIASAYWFTASTSFANPAITLARSLSDSFAGIAPASVPGFVVAQMVGALTAYGVFKTLFSNPKDAT